jgi:hypothetical protein
MITGFVIISHPFPVIRLWRDEISYLMLYNNVLDKYAKIGCILPLIVKTCSGESTETGKARNLGMVIWGN